MKKTPTAIVAELTGSLRKSALKKSQLPQNAAVAASVAEQVGNEVALLLHPAVFGANMAKAGSVGGGAANASGGGGAVPAQPRPQGAPQPGVTLLPGSAFSTPSVRPKYTPYTANKAHACHAAVARPNIR